MKKTFGLFVLATVLLTIGFASASVPVCATYQTTFVSGVISDSTNWNAPVSGADVTVDCNGHIEHTTSGADGGYSVEFAASDCGYGDGVSVSASHAGLNGNSESISWYTENQQVGCLQLVVNVACANVPLVPEFGLIAGMATALGAVGLFFFVRRK